MRPVATPTHLPLPPMLITNVQLNILVVDIMGAEEQPAFVVDFGGYIVAVRLERNATWRTLIADLRTPSEHLGEVLDILTTEFGEVTYFNVWSADISERYVTLQEDLAELEASVQGLSGVERETRTLPFRKKHLLVAPADEGDWIHCRPRVMMPRRRTPGPAATRLLPPHARTPPDPAVAGKTAGEDPATLLRYPEGAHGGRTP